MKALISAWLIAALMIVAVSHLYAQAPDSTPDLTTITLEDLMNVKITSVSKKEEKLFKAAAAIYVITQEDIRRSGLTNLPELFRLVPGMEVARVDGNKWAIGIRGFNALYSNKLLVLVDGRSVYSPAFSGVYWEAQNLPLDLIERIEIIRGPGGTLWGANAVNGVINIITKQAKDSPGGLIVVGGGSEEQGFTSAHYGGMIGANVHYRAYTKYSNRGGQVNATGFNAHDWQNWVSGGWRMDWKKSDHNALTVQGDLYDTALRETSTTFLLSNPYAPPALSSSEFKGGNVLGRWNHVFSDRSDTTLQTYFDRSGRQSFDVGEHEDTFDVDFQHRLAIGRRQEIIWGLGYRLIFDQLDRNPVGSTQVTPKEQNNQIFSGFVQDELILVKNRLHLTLGSKLEHNDYVGFQIQPNARLLLTPSPHHTIWAAASRAVRTPSRVNRGLRLNVSATPGPGGVPIISSVFGDPNFMSEELRAYELGYRAHPGTKLSLDISTFYNFYDRLLSADPRPPIFESDPSPHLTVPIQFRNLVNGKIYGLEASANWGIIRHWKFRAGYSYLGAQLSHKLSGRGPDVDIAIGADPRHQFHLHSYLKLPYYLELDTALYRVSRLRGAPGLVPPIPGYTRLDLRFGWKVRETIELSLGLQNLLDDRHSESAVADATFIPSQIKRSVYGKAIWRF